MDIPIQKPLVDVFRWRVTKSPNLIVHKFQQRETTYSQFDIQKEIEYIFKVEDVKKVKSNMYQKEKKKVRLLFQDSPHHFFIFC